MSIKSNAAQNEQIAQAVSILRSGGVIAYPTEAVYGLGADPFNENAVAQVRALKKRRQDNGLILIASDWDQVAELVGECPSGTVAAAKASWPGFVTWVFPTSARAPQWLRGPDNTIGLRVTDHPVARALCKAFGKAIVSTSANLAKQPPATNASQVQNYFGNQLFIVDGLVDTNKKPSPIFDALTGQQLR